MNRAKDHPAHKKKDFSELGHYAVGTTNLIPTTVLGKYHPDAWSGNAQKATLYAYAKGGEVIEHEDGQGKGHRRTLAEVNKLDFSYYL